MFLLKISPEHDQKRPRDHTQSAEDYVTFSRMPFGLRNAVQTLQVKYCTDAIFTKLTLMTLWWRLRPKRISHPTEDTVPSTPQRAQSCDKPSRTCLPCPEVNFLDSKLDKNGIWPFPKKMESNSGVLF